MDIASAFKGIPTGNICDMNGREGSMDAAIKPLDYHFEMTGYAMTVTCVPGDNLTIHRAIAEAKPGVVLVIQCRPVSLGNSLRHPAGPRESPASSSTGPAGISGISST